MATIISGIDSNGVYYEYDKNNQSGTQVSVRLVINGIEYFGLGQFENSKLANIFMFSNITNLNSNPIWPTSPTFHYIINIFQTTKLYGSSTATQDTAMLWEDTNYFCAYYLDTKNPILLRKMSAGASHDGIYSYWMRIEDAPEFDSKVYICKNNSWKQSQPYICISGQWKKVIAWIYKNGQWEQVGKENPIEAPIPVTAAYTFNNELLLDEENNILRFKEGG